MDEATLLRRIEQDPWVLSGKPTVRGLRVTVARIINFLAAGMTRAEILTEFPELTPEDLDACEMHAVHILLGVRRASDEGEVSELKTIVDSIDPDLRDAVLRYADHLGERLAQMPRARAG